MEVKNLFWIPAVLLLGIVITLVFMEFDPQVLNAIRAIGSLLIVASIIIATIQFRLNRKQFQQNNEWNKKQLAMTEAHSVLKNINKYLEVLNPILKYRERKKNNLKPYAIYEIHNAMGVFMKDNSFIFHGQHSKEDYKRLPEESDGEHISYFIEEIDGILVKDSIYSLLNEYEYLAAGVNNGILDEKIVKSLMYTPMKDAFRLFEVYINHVINNHDGNKNMYLEIRNFIAK
jgi:hypothetical protein